MFRYTVTENDYIEMARWMLMKKRGSGFSSVAGLLLSTVVQMGAVLLLELSLPEAKTWIRIALPAMSFLWAGLAVFRYFFLGLRARMLLSQVKKQNPGTDFWKEHRLSLSEDKITVDYGKTRTEMPCRELTGAEHYRGLVLLLHGGDVFEAVPEKTAETAEWKRFEEELLSAAREEKDGQRRKMTEKLMKEGRAAVLLELSPDEVADHLVRMKRRSLFCRAGWSPLMIFTLAFPLVLAAWTIATEQWNYLILSLLAVPVLNLYLLYIFTPFFRKRVLRQVLPAGPEGYCLGLYDKSMYLVTQDRTFRYSIASLKKILVDREDLFLIFENQNQLFIPGSCAPLFTAALQGRKVPEKPEA